MGFTEAVSHINMHAHTRTCIFIHAAEMGGLKLSPQITYFKIEHYHLLLLPTKVNVRCLQSRWYTKSEKKKKNSVSYPLATHFTKNPHPLWQVCHHTAIDMSAAVSQTFMRTHTQKHSHNNTHPSSAQPCWDQEALESRDTFPQKTVGVGGQQRPRLCIHVTFRVSSGCVLQHWKQHRE